MTENSLDDLDHRLIYELQEDGRRSFTDLGEKLGVSPGTARARFHALRESGILEVIAAPNPWRMGLAFSAVVALKLKPGHCDAVADKLAALPEISWVGLVSNEFDVMFEVALADAESFGRYRERLFAELPGFVDAKVFMLWSVRKFRYRMAHPMEA